MNKTCTKCKTTKPIVEFYSSSLCRVCNSARVREYQNTNINNRIQVLLNNAKARAEHRLKKGRAEAGVCNLTHEQLLSLYQEQKGQCYYSGLVMSIESKSDFLVSLERLDPSGPYSINNVALVCLEFNGASQWTPEKIKRVLSLVNQTANSTELQQMVELATDKLNYQSKKMKKDRIIEYRGEVLFLQCNRCKVVFPSNEFTKAKSKIGYRTFCSKCRSLRRKDQNHKTRTFLKSTLTQMKARCSQRAAIDAKYDSTPKSRSEINFTLEQLLLKILEQQGKCYYSGIPLSFKPMTDWQCSAERLNDDLGYTNENVVLVCLEFNTPRQWSKEKFHLVLESIKKKYHDGDVEMKSET